MSETLGRRRTRTVDVTAYAKVNLSLDVLGRRPDGYHELRSVLQTVSLADRLRLFIDEGPPMPRHDGDYSLIDRAIKAVLDWSGASGRVAYRLSKRIPVAAGLGGGSSDALAAIRGTCRLLNFRPAVDDLLSMAEALGSDVTFFVYGGTALIEGRGERVTPLKHFPETWFILANPAVEVPTRAVFGELRMDDAPTGQGTGQVLDGLRHGRAVLSSNDLAAPAMRLFPQIERVAGVLSEFVPGRQVGMSGSGGTVMAAFERREPAEAAYGAIRDRVGWSRLVRSVTAERCTPEWKR